MVAPWQLSASALMRLKFKELVHMNSILRQLVFHPVCKNKKKEKSSGFSRITHRDSRSLEGRSLVSTIPEFFVRLTAVLPVVRKV